MRLPSPALVIACLALLLAAGGVAYGTTVATGQLVNIVDPNNAAQAAKVAPGGFLQVGDGSGPLTVDGGVTAREAPPNTFYRNYVAVNPGSCVAVATPPAGKALIVKTVSLNFVTAAANQYIFLRISPASAPCGGSTVQYVFRPSVGIDVLPFEPGLAIPAGKVLGVFASPVGGDRTLAVTGYTVVASAVPAGPDSPDDTQG